MNLTTLNSNFYHRNTLSVARDLLGKILIRRLGNKTLSGVIVETEAYLSKNDPASHSYRGKTQRNACMFEKGGFAYVYFTYGNHYCFNVVTEKENVGSAVLIRAVQPMEGIDIMMKHRRTKDIYNLTSGPGKLTQALAIDKKLNGTDLTNGVLSISTGELRNFKIVRSKRIGITQNTDKLFRFYIDGNPFVSRIRRNTVSSYKN
jgi:DNA-3-methyladenine glycosylase